MLLVKLTNPLHMHGTWWLYRIYESSTGELIWNYVSVGETKTTSFSINVNDTQEPHIISDEFFASCGYLTECPVTPLESELITGLHYPASMDRLRELVHEH